MSNGMKLKVIFEHEEEIGIRFDDKKSMETQKKDKRKENNSYTAGEKVTFGSKDQKVNNLESTETNLNLDKFEKWMVKIFPPLNLNFLKLSNYSEDDNISNEASHGRLIIGLISITVVLCFITFGQLIRISVLSKSPIVVQPFIPKTNDPFCK